MTQWQNTLCLPEFALADRNEITVQDLARIIAERLPRMNKSLDEYLEDERDRLAYEFEGLANDNAMTKDDFDEVWEQLYDWADTSIDGCFGGRKVCWIDRFGAREQTGEPSL